MTAPVSSDNKIICFHCGIECKDDLISFDDKSFCCSGCKTVYEILDKSNLCTYYNLETNPGISPNLNLGTRFDYLDDPQTTAKLIDFQNEKLTSVTFYIPQMHCSSCIWLLENLFKLNKSVKNSKVDFLKKKLSIHFNHNEITLKQVVQLITSLGYEPQILLESFEKREEPHLNKKLYYKIGIAGFCFGNVMLLSFPEYLSIDISEVFFRKLFGYLNLILSLPVFLYSASGYFISAIQGLRKKIINLDVPISLGILALFIRSSYEVLTFTGAGYFDSLTGLVFFLLIGKFLQEKTYDTLNFERNYKSYFPLAVTVLIDGKEKSIPISKLMVGNRIVIRKNELIPADSILFNGDGKIDYSFVTGESKPVSKVSGEMIYAGGRQMGGAIELEVIKEVSQSYLTQLWNNDTFNKSSESAFTNFSNAVSKYFTGVVLFIAAVATLAWLPSSTSTALNVFTAVLIVACPCALALSTPFTLGNAMRVFGNNRLFVKNSAVIEKTAKITSIVFDKTGTITEPGKSDLIYHGKVLSTEEQRYIKSIVRNSTHPLSKKIFESIESTELLPVTRLNEIAGRGIEGVVYGTHIKIGSSDFIGILTKQYDESYLRTEIHISINDEPIGYFTVSNSYRKGIGEVIKQVEKKYKVSMLSGDNPAERDNLKNIFSSKSKLLFRQTPENKLSFIKSLQSKKEKVMMIGDGLNDAGALSQSDVGISVTDNISNFTPASDAIADAGILNKLPVFLKYSRDSVNVIYINFAISFFYNVIGLSFAVQGILSPLIAAILMPLSSITVVTFATLATNYIAKKRGLI
ncbi:MAG: heavy metal translocating P-type ATPase metal-binding domain-containing protein [Ignavibacterium sp.]|nr:heavy metal translocating P-type ATPase metal-binding domain-containing protein [Ignavibacterium sp.]